MTSTITITPTTNIRNSQVMDNKQVTEREYDSNMDVLTFYNRRSQKLWRGNLMHVSLYEDLIVEGDIQYNILAMLSK